MSQERFTPAQPEPRMDHFRAGVEPAEIGALEASAPVQAPQGSYGEIFRLAGPMVLSSMGLMLMQFVNALFLSWYSQEAVAAVVPASMAAYVAVGLFLGVAGYTSTFVAQYTGAGRPERAGASVWQGVYFSLASGAFVAAFALLAGPLFRWAGHEPGVQELERRYFEISCWSAPLALLGGALSGYFSGRGETRTLMAAQLLAFAVNIFLDYGLIFGHLGMPEWGLIGAAVATAVAQAVLAAALAALFLWPRSQRTPSIWDTRGFDRALFLRLLRFGFPQGARFVVELFAWTMFLFFVGRLGTGELAATGIAWRINGLAFVPVIGLSTAIATLVGQAQGSHRPDLAARSTYRGLLVGEAWMLASAALFFLFPRELIEFFHGTVQAQTDDWERTVEMGIAMLRFVALYCLLDGFNIVLMGALQGAGDTRWTLVVSFVLHAAFLASLLALDTWHASLLAYWGDAAAFVMLQAFVWLARFRSGQWRRMRVIEPAGGGAFEAV